MSMSGDDDNNRVAKKARHCGHVVLNVGGTKFSTSTTTLTSSSAYFQRLFSKEWANSRGNGDDDEVFVDQDPEPFRALLSYMRLGKIEASELTLPVLLQAQYFGMDRLLAAARGVASRSANDSELVKICRSVGILSELAEKEIVSLMLFCTKDIHFDGQEDLGFWGGKEIVACVESVEPKESGGTTTKRTFTTFVDGLNWLHRNGFTKHEDKLGKDFEIADYQVLGVLYFSRVSTNDESMENLESSIIIGGEMCTEERKEFAACISLPGPEFYQTLGAWIEADVGKEEDKNRRSVHNQTAKTRMSRITKLPGADRMLQPNEIPSWLQANKFLTRETDFEEFYRKAFYSDGDLDYMVKNDEELWPSFLTVWSRSIVN